MDLTGLKIRLNQLWQWILATEKRRLWASVIAVPVSWLLLFWLFSFFVWIGLFGHLPTKAELAQIRNYTASEVYSADSVLLGRFFLEDRSEVALENMPDHLLNALVATEDARFYSHRGVDNIGFARVLFKTILLRDKSSGGGSTISQQLAKNLFKRPRLGPLSLPVAKVRESILAKRLEKVYAKKEILALYLNTVPFGENAFGIGAASQRYFSKSPQDLKPEESAVLVGMLKATTAYNPKRNPNDSRGRRNVVLGQMEKNGYLTEKQRDSLQALPLEIKYRYITVSDGSGTYLRQAVRSQLKAWFDAHPKQDSTPYNLYTDGLKIYTTVDSRLQKSAEAAVTKHMKYLQTQFDKHWKGKTPWEGQPSGFLQAVRQSVPYRNMQADGMSEAEILKAMKAKKVAMKVWTWDGEKDVTLSYYDSVAHYYAFLQAGLVAIEPKTGAVKAWVGGIDHRYFKYDHVTSQRQVGSTFKPIVYAAALEYGADPCEMIPNVQESWRGWSPSNADGKYGGSYSMKGGLTHSVNTISAAVMRKVGIPNAVRFSRAVGIESDLAEDPTMVLGTSNLTLLEMTAAYAAIAAGGEYHEPWFVTRVLDADGKLLVEMPVKPVKRQAMSGRTAGLITDMMRSVVNQGTAGSLRGMFGFTADIAGKTGTTQDQADGWFIGITPGLACGVWVGGPDRTVRFRSMSLGQGARTALPIWGHFMTRFYQSDFQKMRSPSLPYPFSSDSMVYDCPLFIPDPDTAIDLSPVVNSLQELFKKATRSNDTVRGRNTSRPDEGDKPRKRGLFQKKDG